MIDLRPTIEKIKEAADRVGLAAFAREAGVPYTTARDWALRDWEPKGIKHLDRFLEAADRLERPDGKDAA
jgi:hypothetical protein